MKHEIARLGGRHCGSPLATAEGFLGAPRRNIPLGNRCARIALARVRDSFLCLFGEKPPSL